MQASLLQATCPRLYANPRQRIGVIRQRQKETSIFEAGDAVVVLCNTGYEVRMVSITCCFIHILQLPQDVDGTLHCSRRGVWQPEVPMCHESSLRLLYFS